KRDILNICKETRCELKSLPGVYQLANGEVSLSKMKAVAVEDLLGREPIKVKMEEIFQYLRGKTILVTGGGGSIGSELCRQIAGHGPKQLIIFDIYENNAYDIEQELRRQYPNLNLVVLIGSVRDSRRINMVFEKYKPDIVYHAAAHKHVPLMETSPNEAIKNNVIGTYKTAYAAMKNGTDRFVLISTDKAVNPTNIMGASKRLCEMVIQSMDAISKAGRMDLLPFLHAHKDKLIDGQVAGDPMDHMGLEDNRRIRIESVKNKERTGTQFVAVRFGNVLGSNGSVIPLFKKQIEEGGPVTVTHPDIVRYFMTIPEAVSLVLQAGTYAWGGEIFVLDMGEPVKIDTLARNLIKLSGYTPDVDIMIQYSGLRPGEKLYEEKLMAEEGMKKTDNELIHIGKPIPFDTEEFLRQLEELAKASYENSDEIVEIVERIVPTFHPMGQHPASTKNGKKKNRAMDEAAVTRM
ncbi:MAG: nucleoside-diphosphate sugar epimerase/dehydratase, partial [Eubacteriales bacterium]|nr:nucleoside-diphosphate sugar epimerase/dehydratase [Eubacteriales bacterium]